MTDNSFSAGGHEDLPRTVRQQKEARAREIMAGTRTPYARPAGRATAAAAGGQFDEDFQDRSASPPGEDPPATVTRLHLPFFHLMGFWLKAVLAAIPAMVLAIVILMSIFWAAGQIVEHYAPWLVKMRIVVSFPG